MVKKYLPIFFLLTFSFHALGWITAADSFFLPCLKEQKNPLWWEIKIVLLTEGEYKLEKKEASYSGDYSFTTLWTGCMERDDADYLLYHQESRLLHWKAKEKEVFPEFSQMKSGKDFKERPLFHLIYILKKEENLHFDFIVQGFSIPQSESKSKLFLQMPCSGDKSDLHPEINYESFIVKGSNLIFLEEKDIYAAPVDREFTWTWKRYTWAPSPENPIRLTNLHKVKVKISIEPHF